MYRVTKIVKTYACRKAINTSRNIIIVTIIHGKTDRTTKIEPDVKRAQEKPIRIFNSACPDIIFAKSRMLKLKIRATYETASMKIRNGAIGRGAPEGRNRSKNCHR